MVSNRLVWPIKKGVHNVQSSMKLINSLIHIGKPESGVTIFVVRIDGIQTCSIMFKGWYFRILCGK